MPKSKPKINKDNLKAAIADNKKKVLELLEIYKTWGEAWASSEKGGEGKTGGKDKFAVTIDGTTSTYGANAAKKKKNEYLDDLTALVDIAFPAKTKATTVEKLLKKLKLVKVVAALRNFKNADLGNVTINGTETPLAAELAVFKTGVSYIEVIGKVFNRYVQVHNLYENATSNQGTDKIGKKFAGADDVLKKQFGKIFAEAPKFDPDNFSFVGSFTGLKKKFIESNVESPSDEEYDKYLQAAAKLLKTRPDDPDVFTDALAKVPKPSDALKFVAGAHRDHAVFDLLIPKPQPKAPKAPKAAAAGKAKAAVGKGAAGKAKGAAGKAKGAAGKAKAGKAAAGKAKAKVEEDDSEDEADEADEVEATEVVKPKKAKGAAGKAAAGKAKASASKDEEDSEKEAADEATEEVVKPKNGKKANTKAAASKAAAGKASASKDEEDSEKEADVTEEVVKPKKAKASASKADDSEASTSKPKKSVQKASKAPQKLIDDDAGSEASTDKVATTKAAKAAAAKAKATASKAEEAEPETEEPETDEPETDEPETDEPETEEPETDEPETEEAEEADEEEADE